MQHLRQPYWNNLEFHCYTLLSNVLKDMCVAYILQHWLVLKYVIFVFTIT